MGVKEELLGLFENHRGEYLSGGELGRWLGVSCNAVWKAVQALQGEGYTIEGICNRGYRLSPGTDILSAAGIKKYLRPAARTLQISVRDQVDSTNNCLKSQASQLPSGYVLLALSQTAGRGRFGRAFYSPGDSGLYMSLLLRPSIPGDRVVGITTMAAVAVCRAIDSITGKRAQIKWVNDILLSGKKVAGILTEASLSMESGSVEHVVLGIGVNVYAPRGGFPEELQEKAGSLLEKGENDAKNRLAAAILNEFMDLYPGLEGGAHVQAYRERSLVIGRKITVLSPEGPRTAMALDLDEACGLLVRYPDGREERLSYGEISLAYSFKNI